MKTFTTNEVVYTVDDKGVTAKYDLGNLVEKASAQLDYAKELVDQINDKFENFELIQSINPKWCEKDPFETRRYWRHIPNHNVKRKLHK